MDFKENPESYAYYSPQGEQLGFSLEEFGELEDTPLASLIERSSVRDKERIKNITEAILKFYDERETQ